MHSIDECLLTGGHRVGFVDCKLLILIGAPEKIIFVNKYAFKIEFVFRKRTTIDNTRYKPSK